MIINKYENAEESDDQGTGKNDVVDRGFFARNEFKHLHDRKDDHPITHSHNKNIHIAFGANQYKHAECHHEDSSQY